MNNRELIQKLEAITKKNTRYLWGTFGAEITEKLIADKSKQYPSWYHTTRQGELRTLIGKGYYAFDCIGLIKAVLWGWDGSTKTSHGGAVYKSNGMPDTNANGYIKQCKNVSSNFSSLEPGEAVWMPGHIGVYVGNGEVIEATPSWKNGVQRTKLSARRWEKHGLMPQIEYVQDEPEVIELLRTTANLHMRSGAGTSHASILVIPKGTDVQVISKSAGWAKVSYKGKMGYSSVDYLMAVPSRKGGNVIASVLNVRSGPGVQNRIMGTLLKDTPVEVLETVSGWYKIRYGTTTAYVSADWVSYEKVTAPVVVITKEGVVTAKIGLNVRKSPGGAKVSAIKEGTKVRIYEQSGSWYRIGYGEWVAASYIKIV